MSDEENAKQVRAGYLYGLVAYTIWGLIPLYFSQVKTVPPQEILSHRIVWSLGIMLLLVVVTGTGSELIRVMTSLRLLATLTLSSLLLATNWLLYIYATVNNRVSEASLGYFMMPLVNTFLGSVFLKEKLRPLHYPALACVVVGILIPVLAGSPFTWLAVVLPISFGCYGCVRKAAPVDSLTGLTVETIILTVPSAAYLLWQKSQGEGRFLVDTHDSLWLMLGGIATVLPLLTYTLSIRRLPLIAMSFIQFLSPTIQMLMAVAILHEDVRWERWAAVGCVLVAVAIFLGDAVIQNRRKRNAVRRVVISSNEESVAMASGHARSMPTSSSTN
ncbi:MAG: EamA family transporter RarD [Gemmataceae bacterium]